MGEDLTFFNALRRSCGEARALLLPDDCGTCIHTLHGKNTSDSFCLREVHREDIQDLDVAETGDLIGYYLRTYPRVHSAFSSSIHFESKDPALPRPRHPPLAGQAAAAALPAGGHGPRRARALLQ